MSSQPGECDVLSRLSLSHLREKAGTLGLVKAGNKKDMIETIQREFNNLANRLRQYNLSELKECCKMHKIVGFSSMKKDEIISVILRKNTNLLSEPKEPWIIPKKQESTNDADPIEEKSTTKEELEVEPVSTKEEPRKEIVKPELLKEIVKEDIKKEEPEPVKEDIKKEEPRKVETKEDIKKEEPEPVKEESKKKKQQIPKAVRVHVWNLYIGPNIIEHRCLCCKKTLIKNTDFEVGHIISEKEGGTQEISNLRPICSPCNLSMGTTNMVEYVKRYGYYVG